MTVSDSAFPKHARVVIIGGGVVGCSVAYHLAKKGLTDIVLLERRELSCGSSWHAAGQFHIINSNANLSGLQLHTLKFYPQLQEESGQDIGLHRTGGLYFASTKERLNYLIQEQAKNRRHHPDMQFIDLAEAKKMHPLIDAKHFLGALYDPLDGHIDPASVVQAFAKAAKKFGAQIHLQTFVKNLKQKNDGWEVSADRGTIRAEAVVNAGGLWAREVGRLAGAELPILAMEHHYLITESIDEIKNLGRELPAMVDFDGNAYGRQEGFGMLLGTYEEGGQPWAAENTPWDFGHELLPDKLERIAPRLETAFQHFPKLKTAGIKKVVNGPFTFAPDGNALIGPVPGLKNFWAACGVMAGFCQGAGIGKVFADWFADGEPGMDVFAMDIARFGGFATRRYTKNKVVENFGRRFMVAYPNEELPAMRPWRTTPLYDRLKNYGAVYGASFGLEHALWFADNKKSAIETPTFLRSNAHPFTAAEVLAVRNHVGCIETANFAKYTVGGENAESWLDGLLAGKMPGVGQIKLSPMLSNGGKLIGDLTVARLSQTEFLIVGSGAAQTAHWRHFQNQLPSSGVVLQNRCNELLGLAIAGPKSRRLLQKLTTAPVCDEKFPFMHLQKMEAGGVPAIVLRVSYTGELGYEIYATADYHLALFEAIMNAGEEFNIKPFGARALMSMRLEKSFGAWGLDFREDFTPQESGLALFVDGGKAANFIGKQAFLRQQKTAPKKRRLTLIVDAKNADAKGDEPIYKNDKIVGFITSGGYGHFVDKSIAIGYADADALNESDSSTAQFAVELLGKKCPAKIQQKPLHDPDGGRMRK